jgi:hypothetical protein
MKLVGDQLLGSIDDMKMRPPPGYFREQLAQSATLQFCNANHLPLGTIEPDHSASQSVNSFERAHRQH